MSTLDVTNNLPIGGYFAPLIPPGWAEDATNLAQVFMAMDATVDVGRKQILTLQFSHIISTAAGADLDALGAIFGIVRVPGELDTAYRARIPATIQHGINASTAPDMTTYLQQALGVPVQVADGPPGSGSFSVLVQGNIPTASSVPALVRSVKAAGFVFTSYALLPLATSDGPLADTFRLGDLTCGGSSSRVFLGS